MQVATPGNDRKLNVLDSRSQFYAALPDEFLCLLLTKLIDEERANKLTWLNFRIMSELECCMLNNNILILSHMNTMFY